VAYRLAEICDAAPPQPLQARNQEGRSMMCLVDAGTIFPAVFGVSARDCALNVIADIGERAHFPIDVYDWDADEWYRFVLQQSQLNFEERNDGNLFSEGVFAPAAS
jgi:hypothetical protein